MSVYIACDQNSSYYFRTVVTHVTYGLLAVVAFLESSKMPTADWRRGETAIIVKGDDTLSRFHA